MQSFSGVKSIKTRPQASVVCLGNFDGLHLGHRALIDRTLAGARELKALSVVFTFSPHPAQVLYPERPFRALFSREDLTEQLGFAGVDWAVYEPFTPEFAALKPESFVREFLVAGLGARRIVVGPDFAFGQGRSGSIEQLRDLGGACGFDVDVPATILLEGEAVSSTRIRRALGEGRIAEAEKMLGRRYYMTGTVTRGAGRGHGLGFPTANFTPVGLVTPKRGVYITSVSLGGRSYPSVTNVGGAPTFSELPSEARLETHILDQNLELTGVQIRVEFVSYLREERRFQSVDELTRQIRADAEAARKYWRQHS